MNKTKQESKKLKNSQKRVDVIVKYFHPVTAGIETNILETYQVLAKKGWRVVIHTSRDSYLDKDILPKYEQLRGMEIQRYSFKPWGFVPKIDWRDTKLICFHNFDIFPHSYLLFYFYLRKLLGNRFSVVLTPHGGFSLGESFSVFPMIQGVIKRLYHKTLAPVLINKSVDSVRAVSDWEKNEMEKDGVDKKLITVISNGIENEAYSNVDKDATDLIKNKVTQWGKYIIQVGRVYPIKNYETTIKALKYVSSDIKFVIVGPVEKNKNPEYWESLQNLILKLKLENRVIFTGVIRGTDKFYAMKKAQIMVHMAIWESFCNVVHEGMSQGLPVIVANNTALPYLVKNGVNGYLVNTKDFKKVAERINFILDTNDKNEINEMREKNRTFGREHAWKKVAEKMDVLYKGLV